MQLLYSVLYIFIIARSGNPHTSFQFILSFHLEKFIYVIMRDLYNYPKFILFCAVHDGSPGGLCGPHEADETSWLTWRPAGMLRQRDQWTTQRGTNVRYFSVYQPHFFLHSELAQIGVCDWYTAKKKKLKNVPWKSAWIHVDEISTLFRDTRYAKRQYSDTFLCSPHLTCPVVWLTRRGDTIGFAVSFLHPFRSWVFLKASLSLRPVHSLMLSSHIFLWRPQILLPFTVPWSIV